MKYEIPEVTVLTPAINAIQSVSGKEMPPNRDSEMGGSIRVRRQRRVSELAAGAPDRALRRSIRLDVSEFGCRMPSWSQIYLGGHCSLRLQLPELAPARILPGLVRGQDPRNPAARSETSPPIRPARPFVRPDL